MHKYGKWNIQTHRWDFSKVELTVLYGDINFQLLNGIILIAIKN